jgi:hypothetical protein
MTSELKFWNYIFTKYLTLTKSNQSKIILEGCKTEKKYVVFIYLFIIFILGYYFYSRCSSFIGRTTAAKGQKISFCFYFIYYLYFRCSSFIGRTNAVKLAVVFIYFIYYLYFRCSSFIGRTNAAKGQKINCCKDVSMVMFSRDSLLWFRDNCKTTWQIIDESNNTEWWYSSFI